MKNPEMRISNVLYCSMALTFGGEQIQLVKLLSHLDRERFRPFVCCIRRFGYVEQQIVDLASRFICLQVGSRYNILGEIRRLRKAIKDNNIDLIQTGIFGSDFSPLLTAMIIRTPVIAFLTTTYDLDSRLATVKNGKFVSYWKSRIFYMVHAILARLVKVQYIAYSQTIKESAIKNLHLPPERISIVPLGLDPEEFDGWARHQEAAVAVKDKLGLHGSYPILLNVARMSSVKGQQYLVKAMPRILERFPGAQLLIAGDGDVQVLQELSQLREQLRLEEHVHLLGRRDDISNLLHISSIFVFSSYYEGLPGAVIEAMAAARPVVAFDIPSLKEIIQDQYNGVLVKKRDVNLLAQAVIQLAERPQVGQQMGNRSRDIVKERFDIRLNIQELEALYQKMLIK